MSRYIDVDKFIEDLGFENTEREREENIGEIVTLEDFDRQPTEDVVKITHGQWQKHYKSGTTVSDGFVSSCCDMWNERKTPYCPNCGAKMNKREDEG